MPKMSLCNESTVHSFIYSELNHFWGGGTVSNGRMFSIIETMSKLSEIKKRSIVVL